MLIVKVFINDKEIISKTARRLDVPAKKRNRYVCDDGKEINHNYAKGAAKLAIKLLKDYKEPTNVTT